MWLYFRFALSFRDVELMMAQRGIVVSYESIRSWCEKFGRQYSRKIRRQRGRMGDAWDTAHAVLFLASDEARYITATHLVVDGGLTAARPS